MADVGPAVKAAPGGVPPRSLPSQAQTPPVSEAGDRSASSWPHFNERVLDIAVCAGAYLYGSVPLVYLLARQRRVDLRRVGSGNVGATNLMASGGVARAAAGWIFDTSKGLVPILVSRRLGRSRAVAELAGVCGVAGQCWPLFLRFSGGRGISAYVGAGAGMDRAAWSGSLLPMIGGSLWRVAPRLRRLVSRPIPRGTPAAAPQKPFPLPSVNVRSLRFLHVEPRRAPLAAHREGPGVRFPVRSKSVPLGCFISALVFPLLVGARRGWQPRTLVAPTLLSCVIVARRLTASLPDDATHGPAVYPKAWLYRLLYDRNTSK